MPEDPADHVLDDDDYTAAADDPEGDVDDVELGAEDTTEEAEAADTSGLRRSLRTHGTMRPQYRDSDLRTIAPDYGRNNRHSSSAFGRPKPKSGAMNLQTAQQQSIHVTNPRRYSQQALRHVLGMTPPVFGTVRVWGTVGRLCPNGRGTV